MGTPRLTARERLDRAMSESAWQSLVIEFAKRNGWLCHHSRPVWDGKRWLTALQGDSGFPDLVMARDGEVIIAELKTEVGWHWKPGQQEWIAATGAVLWKPSDWLEVQRRLAR